MEIKSESKSKFEKNKGLLKSLLKMPSINYNLEMNSEITVELNKRKFCVSPYTVAEEILEKAGFRSDTPYEENAVVGVIINGVLNPLNAVIQTENTTLTPVYVFDFYGRRIYRHTLCFLLFMAAHEVFPKQCLRIGHSMGNSLFFYCDNYKITANDVKNLSDKMREIVKQNLRINVVYLSSEEAVKYFKKHNQNQTVILLENYNRSCIQVYKVKKFVDICYEVLAPRTGVLSLWELEQYEDKGMLLRYPDSANLLEVVHKKNIPSLFRIYEEDKNWGKILGVSSLGEINKKVTNGSVGEHIRHCETLQRRKLYSLTDNIKAKNAKAVFISGPSSSGKTTFAKKICEQLSLMGMDPIQISLDDYYKPRTEIPLNNRGEIDYECIEALRCDLFKQNMEDLFNNKEVNLPQWSISKQQLSFRHKPSKMTENTVFVIEGIHALNPVFTSCVPGETAFRIFISALTQLTLDCHNRISTADIRILRRIIRDNRTRGVDAKTTLEMKSSVAEGERKHIFPFQSNADAMFNSSLDYEIGVLSTYVIPLLSEVPPHFTNAYTEARRLLAFLMYVNPIPSDKVPSDSILREFIGNGDYE